MDNKSSHTVDRIPLSLHSVFKRMHVNLGEDNHEHVLGQTQVQRRVLQEFRPIAKSLEWELGKFSWDDLGVLPFAENEVPFVITSSGRLSENAAVLLFECCKKSPPKNQFQVLELGAGTGLFARLLLDRFKAICDQHNTDYYDRLLYIATDGSRYSIEQWQERAIFDGHENHVQPMVHHAEPSAELPCFNQSNLTAVFCNYVLINDYGPVNTDDVEKQIISQRFGSTMALGINFPFLEAHFALSDWEIVVPDNDAEAPIHARLIVRRDTKQPADFFRSRFGSEGQRYFEQPITEAREHAHAGRKNEALEAYKTALTRNRSDWFAMGEIAEYVGLQLADSAAGLELAKEAIKLNPWYSAWLWNVLGDCLFCQDRFSDAHEAYLQAYRINPQDARTNLNLAFSHVQLSRYDEALCAIARGLAHDPGGLQREQLLEKQRQILSQLSARSLGEQERLMRRALSQQ